MALGHGLKISRLVTRVKTERLAASKTAHGGDHGTKRKYTNTQCTTYLPTLGEVEQKARMCSRDLHREWH